MSGSFRVGVNYWPAATAMRWWRRFDREQVSRDFAEIRAAGGDTIRFFLLWEDFQPRSDTVSEAALARLRAVADAAGRQGLMIIPTLFTGHMSGANFIPEWALGAAGSGRFRVVSKDRVVGRAIRNWYADELGSKLARAVTEGRMDAARAAELHSLMAQLLEADLRHATGVERTRRVDGKASR